MQLPSALVLQKPPGWEVDTQEGATTSCLFRSTFSQWTGGLSALDEEREDQSSSKKLSIFRQEGLVMELQYVRPSCRRVPIPSSRTWPTTAGLGA